MATTMAKKKAEKKAAGRKRPAASKARAPLSVEDLPPTARDRMLAYDRCSGLQGRTPGERAAAEDQLADDLDSLLTALRCFCGRQHLAVRAAAVVIQPAAGLPPVIVPMDGRQVPGCVVPFEYQFVGWSAR